MKILQLCLRVPYPPVDGGTIAMYNMALSLTKANASVKIIAFNTAKHFVDPAGLPDAFTQTYRPEMVFLDARVKVIPALINIIKRDSYNVSRFDIPLFHATLSHALAQEDFDIVQLESVFMTPYIKTIRKNSKAKIVLRAHNMEYLIWQRLAESETAPIRKRYLQFLSRRLRAYEAAVINQIDAVVALTKEDQQLFREMGCKVPVLVSPIGLDSSKYKISHNKEVPMSLVHLGSMDWLPNIEGVDWFLNKVLPLLQKYGVKNEIFLAGKSMPDRMFKLSSNQLHIEGRIDDAQKYLSDKQIMIVPLLSGGGMRVKIIEGLAMGKTIISTTIGAEGIIYEEGRNMLIADSPESFSEAIIHCLKNKDKAFRIGTEAGILARKVYDNEIIGAEIVNFYSGISKH